MNSGNPGDAAPTLRVGAWILTAIMAATVCYSVLRIPLQVTDSLIPMLDAQRTDSVIGAFTSGATAQGYFRPLRSAQIQAVFELAHGHYFGAFKGFQVALVLVTFALFLMVLEVEPARRSATREGGRARVAALLFALTVLMGLHTFRGTVWEAYPVNHSLEIVAFCLLALALSRSRGGAWADVTAAAAFVAATFTVESGLLVWVVIVAAWLAGARGISRRGVLIVTALMVGYVALRFGYLRTGVPALTERSSGFGLQQLAPDELQRRFGASPYGFYAYNVITSILSVLFSEPRAGIWTIPSEFMRGRIAGGTVINVVSSTITTIAIAWFVATRWGAWRQRQFDRDDQIVFIAMAMILANGIISYSYTKDEIMGPAGVFYALAAFVAVASIVGSSNELASPKPRSGGGGRAPALALVLCIAASGWVVRTAGLHYQMHLITFYDRNEWVYVDDWLASQKSTPATAEGKALVNQLRGEALDGATINPYLLSPRLDQWFR